MEIIFNAAALVFFGLQLLFIGYIVYVSSSKDTKELIRDFITRKKTAK